MNKKIFTVLMIFCCGAELSWATDLCWRVKPIATESIVAQSPDPDKTVLYGPTITVGINGRLIVAFEVSGTAIAQSNPTGTGKNLIYVSDNKGISWNYRRNYEMMQSRLFTVGSDIYLLGHIGHRGDVQIMKSENNGHTWTEPAQLTSGESWSASSNNVISKGQYVYTVMERNDVDYLTNTWDVSEATPVLMRGDTTQDLTTAAAWTFAGPMPFCETIEDHDLDHFGVPFFGAYYPNKIMLADGLGFPPVGWLESNVVQITDPAHYWYDETGSTFHIFSRAHTGKTNLATVIKAVEQSDGSIETMLETAPSGKTNLYVPLPGGQMKFFVLYDDVSQLYWLLSTQSTDSMTRVEMLPEDRYGAPDNERRRLQLHFSKNMVDWCFACMVAVGSSEKASRHYASMVIDGRDLLILSRSGDQNAQNAHNGNLITFHKIEFFRRLAY